MAGSWRKSAVNVLAGTPVHGEDSLCHYYEESEGLMKRIFMTTIAAALLVGGVAAAVAAPASAGTVSTVTGDTPDNRDM